MKKYFLEYNEIQGQLHQSLKIVKPVNDWVLLGSYSDSFICEFAKEMHCERKTNKRELTIKEVLRLLEWFKKTERGLLYA
jgi:hypothetical protein